VRSFLSEKPSEREGGGGGRRRTLSQRTLHYFSITLIGSDSSIVRYTTAYRYEVEDFGVHVNRLGVVQYNAVFDYYTTDNI
jgi:hypothetical protein